MPSYQPPVHRTHGATALVIRNGGLLDVTSGQVRLPTAARRGDHTFDLFDARAMSSAENFLGASVSATGGNLINAIGGLLNANSTPILGVNATDSQVPSLTWASGVVTQVNFSPFMVPANWDSATNITLNVIAERASDNASNNTFALRLWCGTATGDKGTTGSTLTSLPAKVSISIAGSALSGYPSAWAVAVAPITHTNNAVKIHGSPWLEYRVNSTL